MTHDPADLKKTNKAELVEIADGLGIATDGLTADELRTAIAEHDVDERTIADPPAVDVDVDVDERTIADPPPHDEAPHLAHHEGLNRTVIQPYAAIAAMPGWVDQGPAPIDGAGRPHLPGFDPDGNPITEHDVDDAGVQAHPAKEQ